MQTEIAEISKRVNGRQVPSEYPLSGYCQSLSETVLRNGVAPGPCLSLK